jgi:hypothetical protein
MIRILFIFLTAFFSIHGYSQLRTWNWAVTPCLITDPRDSAFLVDTEKKMWIAERETNAFTIYEGFNGGWGYNVRVSKLSMELHFQDTMISKLHFSNTAELSTLWNIDADTFWLIGFQPMINVQRRNWNGGKLKTCYVHIPLHTYKSVIEPAEMTRLKNLTLTSLSNVFRASRSGDTLFRIINFIDDSNRYLPQASFGHLGKTVKEGLLSGKLTGYADKERLKKLSKRELELSFVYWDSTKSVEDPNNPGYFILAPIKVDNQPLGIVVYESWMPALCAIEKERAFPFYRPQPYMYYTRGVRSYGVLLYSGKIIWIDPFQFNSYFQYPRFNMHPYEESFRAERFQTMNIELYPY